MFSFTQCACGSSKHSGTSNSAGCCTINGSSKIYSLTLAFGKVNFPWQYYMVAHLTNRNIQPIDTRDTVISEQKEKELKKA